MVKFTKDPVYYVVDLVTATIPSLFVRAYDSTMAFFGSEMHSNRAHLIDLKVEPEKRYEALQRNFDDSMAEYLPNYKRYTANEVSFSIKFVKMDAEEVSKIVKHLEGYTGFEKADVGKDGSTKFIKRIYHIHDDFHGVATELAGTLSRVRFYSGEIGLQFEYIKCLRELDMPAFMDVTSPVDAQALAAAQKDGATVAPKATGELDR